MRNIFTLIFIGMATTLMGQVTFQPRLQAGAQQKGVVYEKEHTGHTKFHTGGFSLGYDFGKLVSYDKTEYYSIEIGYLKHPKEYKQRSRATSASIIGSPVTYGKINNLLMVKGLFKKKHYLSEKTEKKGVAVGYSYAVGLTAGLLKPYYISIIDYDAPWSLEYKSIKYEESTAEIFLDYNSISGAESYFKGFNEAKIIPGVTADVSVVFDLGAFDAFARSLEVGMMIDIFTQNIPLMAESSTSPYFINAYINIYLGQRW